MAAGLTSTPEEAVEYFSEFRSASARARELARDFAEATSIRRVESGFAVVRAARSGVTKLGATRSSAPRPTIANVAGTPSANTKAPPRPKLQAAKKAPASRKIVRVPTVRAATNTKMSGKKPVAKIVRVPTVQTATNARTSGKKPVARKTGLVPGRAIASRPTPQFTAVGRMSRARASRMAYELRHAFEHMSQKASRAWIQRTLGLFASVMSRRVENLGVLGLDIAEWLGRELIDASKATLDGKLATHVAGRSSAGKRKLGATANRMKRQVQGVIVAFKKDPQAVGPELMVASLAAFVSSGGLDGNGGVPDSDITLLGIDAHRSLLTHSILSGAVIEAGLFSLVDFISRSHRHLPEKHDRYWDVIHSRSKGLAQSGAQGVSLGLAYHLGVDAVLQPGAYHDLPFPMPIEAHQAVLGANAAAEGLDVRAKTPRSLRGTSKTPISPPPRSAAPKERDDAATLVGVASILIAWFLGMA